jgi:hypothetical protein
MMSSKFWLFSNWCIVLALLSHFNFTHRISQIGEISCIMRLKSRIERPFDLEEGSHVHVDKQGARDKSSRGGRALESPVKRIELYGKAPQKF